MTSAESSERERPRALATNSPHVLGDALVRVRSRALVGLGCVPLLVLEARKWARRRCRALEASGVIRSEG